MALIVITLCKIYMMKLHSTSNPMLNSLHSTFTCTALNLSSPELCAQCKHLWSSDILSRLSVRQSKIAFKGQQTNMHVSLAHKPMQSATNRIKIGHIIRKSKLKVKIPISIKSMEAAILNI